MRVRFGGVEWGTDTIDVMISLWCSTLRMCRESGSLVSKLIYGYFHLTLLEATTDSSFQYVEAV